MGKLVVFRIGNILNIIGNQLGLLLKSSAKFTCSQMHFEPDFLAAIEFYKFMFCN